VSEREREREIIREKVGQGKDAKTSTTCLAYTAATHRLERTQVYLCVRNGVYIIHRERKREISLGRDKSNIYSKDAGPINIRYTFYGATIALLKVSPPVYEDIHA